MCFFCAQLLENSCACFVLLFVLQFVVEFGSLCFFCAQLLENSCAFFVLLFVLQFVVEFGSLCFFCAQLLENSCAFFVLLFVLQFVLFCSKKPQSEAREKAREKARENAKLKTAASLAGGQHPGPNCLQPSNFGRRVLAAGLAGGSTEDHPLGRPLRYNSDKFTNFGLLGTAGAAQRALGNIWPCSCRRLRSKSCFVACVPSLETALLAVIHQLPGLLWTSSSLLLVCHNIPKNLDFSAET